MHFSKFIFISVHLIGSFGAGALHGRRFSLVAPYIIPTPPSQCLFPTKGFLTQKIPSCTITALAIFIQVRLTSETEVKDPPFCLLYF